MTVDQKNTKQLILRLSILGIGRMSLVSLETRKLVNKIFLS